MSMNLDAFGSDEISAKCKFNFHKTTPNLPMSA